MIVVNKYKYEKSHKGSGIVDTILNIAKEFGPKLLQSAATSAASEIGKQMISKFTAPNASSASPSPQAVTPPQYLPALQYMPQYLPANAQALQSLMNVSTVPNVSTLPNTQTAHQKALEILNKYQGSGTQRTHEALQHNTAVIDIRDYVRTVNVRGGGIKIV